jgi:hypothetical protein
VAFIAHVYEEYRTYMLGLPDVMQSAPFKVTLELMLTVAASLAPILWLLGAVMMLKRWQAGYFVASTFLFGMMFIEPTHFFALSGSPAGFTMSAECGLRYYRACSAGTRTRGFDGKFRIRERRDA